MSFPILFPAFRRLFPALVLSVLPLAAAATGPSPGTDANDRTAGVPAPAVVSIRGAVAAPGHYLLSDATHISGLIAAAGGLRPGAYPYGAILVRKSLGAREAHMLASQRGVFCQGGTAFLCEPGTLSDSDLRRVLPLGRMVIEADPVVLAARPYLDTALENGDAVYVPARPAHVSVWGMVRKPGTVAFVPAGEATGYIEASGGLLGAANPGGAFMILPNGEARHLKILSWNRTRTLVPPGAVIVIPPRDATTSVTGAIGRALNSAYMALPGWPLP